MAETTVMYAPSTGQIADVCLVIEGITTNMGAYSGKTMEVLAQEYGELIALPISEAADRQETMILSKNEGVIEITEDRFHDALNCLPPMRWTRRVDAESFYISEAHSGRIHSAYIRLGKRYFSLVATRSTTHEDLVAKVGEAIRGNNLDRPL